MKKCKKCGEVKDRNNFNSHRTNSDGLHGSCKSCMRKYHARYDNTARKFEKLYNKKPTTTELLQFKEAQKENFNFAQWLKTNRI